MKWEVEFHDAFYEEHKSFPLYVKENIISRAKTLEKYGSGLGRPLVDTLNGSEFPNMKEIRFSVENEVWRLAFAFDPNRKAILLVAGDKKGKNQKKFYKKLIKIADSRFLQHLNNLEKKE